MPRFITVIVGCDWAECTVEAPEGDEIVIERTVAVDGKQGKTFLVCKQHSDQLDEILMPLLQKGVKVENGSGRKKARASAAAAAPSTPTVASTGGTSGGAGDQEFLCQAPSKHDPDQPCGRTLHNRTGMAQHVIRTHKFESLADYEQTYPQHPDNHE